MVNIRMASCRDYDNNTSDNGKCNISHGNNEDFNNDLLMTCKMSFQTIQLRNFIRKYYAYTHICNNLQGINLELKSTICKFTMYIQHGVTAILHVDGNITYTYT